MKLLRIKGFFVRFKNISRIIFVTSLIVYMICMTILMVIAGISVPEYETSIHIIVIAGILFSSMIFTILFENIYNLKLSSNDKRFLSRYIKVKPKNCRDIINRITKIIMERGSTEFQFKEYNIKTETRHLPPTCNVYKNGSPVINSKFRIYSCYSDSLYLYEFFYKTVTKDEDKLELEKVLFELI